MGKERRSSNGASFTCSVDSINIFTCQDDEHVHVIRCQRSVAQDNEKIVVTLHGYEITHGWRCDTSTSTRSNRAAGTDTTSSPHFIMAKRLRDTSFSPEPNPSVDSDGSERHRSESMEADGHTPKYASLEPEQQTRSKMKCTLPPHHPMTFNTSEEYESHYQQNHTNRCSDCGKNFPTTHFLDLHIAENHDPITAAKRDAGEKTYVCFVEDCDRLCSEWRKRRSHLVDKHGFPRNYNFLVVDTGIDHRKSMLRAGVDAQGHRKSSRERKRSSSDAIDPSQTTDATTISGLKDATPPGRLSKEPSVSKVEEESNGDGVAGGNANVNDLTSSFSSLTMVPRSVTFGRRQNRAGFAKS